MSREPAVTRQEPVGSSLIVRVLGWLVSLILGAVFGALGTVMHQATVHVGSVPIPYGYLLATLALVLLLFGLRLAGSRIAVACAAVGAIAFVGVLSLRSPGGSVLIPANVLGYVWTFTPTVIALLALVWPLKRLR